ncbi:MAG: aminoacyl-tRNA hydrolase [Erysipelotrichaceae bacterium]|nr:aminoacyl-tRNA hydrolase [Erysipelotrichaceae bacterium]
MKMIVGLGNPGKEYEKTRHNVGFMVIDKLISRLGLTLDTKKFKGLYTIDKKHDLLILKPQTYMNLSGEAVMALVNYYKINHDDIVIIYDDLDLPVGKLRLRERGSSGGQNGIKNIINLLKNDKIKRIRIGIGNNKLISGPDYVLGKVNKEDIEIFNQGLDKACDALLCFLSEGFTKAMNKYNQ